MRRGFGRRRGRQVDADAAAKPEAARVAALRLLARRDFATAELRERLTSQGFAAPQVELLLAELAAERLLDDERYAAGFVRSHAGRGHGPRRIRQDLAAAGLSEEQITAALQAGPDFYALAREVRMRRFGAEAPQDWKERARQGRFLQYRGFSNDHIGSALGGSGAPDHDIPDDPSDDQGP